MAINEPNLTRPREKAARYLSTYGFIFESFARQDQTIERLDSQLLSMTQKYGSFPGGKSSKSDLGDIIVNVDEVLTAARALSARLGAVLDEFNATVNAVAVLNPRAATVLSKRYFVVGKPVEYDVLARELGYGEDNVKKLCAFGLDAVADILNDHKLGTNLYTFLHPNR